MKYYKSRNGMFFRKVIERACIDENSITNFLETKRLNFCHDRVLEIELQPDSSYWPVQIRYCINKVDLTHFVEISAEEFNEAYDTAIKIINALRSSHCIQ